MTGTPGVREFYDRNTPDFVSLGQGGGAIHRAVWGPGVATREQAFHYVEDQIAALVRDLPAPPMPHVVDLGCGVGASLVYLASHLNIRGTGITISPLQARAAQQHVARAGLADRIRCIEGDYTKLPVDLERADIAYAIESFVHGPDPVAFFTESHRLLRPGGVLVICDDFTRGSTDRGSAHTLKEFCRGWRVNSLLLPDELTAVASDTGFAQVSTTDLTPHLELRRPRDRAIGIGVAVFGWLPLENTRFGHLIGGSALQRGLTRGWLGYDLVVFRRN